MTVKPIEILEKFYAQIPTFKCIPGCFACCGPVPFAKCEWDRIEDKREATGITCPYASASGCAIYDKRPLICRLFGTTDDLPCPHGCRPAFLMMRSVASEMVRVHYDLIDKD